jgi:hypothetical protein
MLKTRFTPATTTALLAIFWSLFVAGHAAAQQQKSGKIICWKDSAGKVVGCGDRVPAEYQQNATKELDKRGITRGTTATAAEDAQRREQKEEQARKNVEEERRLADQKRQDAALLSTYLNENEIDQRRDRDLLQVNALINQQQVSLRNATNRHDEAKKRHDAAAKSGNPAADNLKTELVRATADKQKFEAGLAAREQEKAAISARYAEQKKRFLELKGKQPATASAPAPSAAAKK